MKIYVESNFVLELAFLQEQSQNCEKILTLCESGQAGLLLPAFCKILSSSVVPTNQWWSYKSMTCVSFESRFCHGMTQKARNISVFFRVFPWLKTQFVIPNYPIRTDTSIGLERLPPHPTTFQI